MNKPRTDPASSPLFRSLGKVVGRGLERIRDLGIRPGLDDDLVRHVRIANLASLYLGIMAFPYIFLLHSMGQDFLSRCVVLLLLAYAFTCVLNRMGRFDLSRIWLLAVVNFDVFFYTLHLGKAVGVVNVYFFTLTAPFMLFHIREIPKIALCIAQPVLCWLLIQGPFGLGAASPFSPGAAHLFYLCINTTVAMMLICSTFLIYLSHQKSIVMFRLAKESAERSNRAKGDFLATVSHEIRTPMNGILGSIQLLGMEPLTPRQASYLKLADSCGNLLIAIINDILDFSKIDSGMLVIENVEMDLHEIVAEALELHRPEADRKGLTLALEMDPVCPREVRGDPVRVRQVLLNLISNAVKFTKRGGVIVSLAKLDESGEAYRIAAVVRDTGIGIPPEKLSRLFQAFTQLDSSTSREYGGTGLGLAIAKRLSKLMGGDLEAESLPGQGAAFTFTARFPKRLP